MNAIEEIKSKLNRKFPNSKISNLANKGDWTAASEEAAGYAMWGIWQTLREVAGLPSDETAKQTMLRAARFAK
jgi:hypothetical protein